MATKKKGGGFKLASGKRGRGSIGGKQGSVGKAVKQLGLGKRASASAAASARAGGGATSSAEITGR